MAKRLIKAYYFTNSKKIVFIGEKIYFKGRGLGQGVAGEMKNFYFFFILYDNLGCLKCFF